MKMILVGMLLTILSIPVTTVDPIVETLVAMF
jgi:hypothetical protein